MNVVDGARLVTLNPLCATVRYARIVHQFRSSLTPRNLYPGLSVGLSVLPLRDESDLLRANRPRVQRSMCVTVK